MGYITPKLDAMIMATNYLSPLSPKLPQELTRLRGVAEVLKYIFSFGLIDAGNDRYQACQQTLFAGLSRLPTAQEVSDFNSPYNNNNASLKIEFSVPVGMGESETITATLTHDPDNVNQDILTVVAPNERPVTVALPATGKHISQHLQTLVEAHLRNPRPGVLCNLEGVDLQGADLRRATLPPYDLRGISFAGARLDDWVVRQIADAIREGLADSTALQGANLCGVDLSNVNLLDVILPDNLLGVSFKDALLDGTAVAHITQAIGEGQADLTALQGANLTQVNLAEVNLQGANLSGAILPRDLRDVSFSGALLDGTAVAQIAQSIREELADPTVLRGANLTGVNLAGVNLQGVDLRWVALPDNLRGASFVGAVLDGTEVAHIAQAIREERADPTTLAGTNLRGVDLSDVNLRGVILPRDLRDVSFSGALLDGPAVAHIAQAIREGRADPTALLAINLMGVNLAGVNLQGVDLPWLTLSHPTTGAPSDQPITEKPDSLSGELFHRARS
ncbi:TPA: pentapeptide repeat-containing protein [Yersinia enterocolitica]